MLKRKVGYCSIQILGPKKQKNPDRIKRLTSVEVRTNYI